MLKTLVESKLSTNFLIIEDKEDLSSQALFVSFLENSQRDDSVKKVNLICYENPPKFYLSNKSSNIVIQFNYFSQPLGWDEPAASKTDLSCFLLNPENLSESIFFIDSISTLVYYHGYYAVYKTLSLLKKHSKKIICVLHGDLFSPSQLEELKSLATCYIKLCGFFNEKNSEEIVCEVTYSKVGGKIIKQNEIFTIKNDFNVESRILKKETSVSLKPKKDLETLTTFKLGLSMSEEEKKARDELILPYIKNKTQNEELSNQLMACDLEDDPDDDLDI